MKTGRTIVKKEKFTFLKNIDTETGVAVNKLKENCAFLEKIKQGVTVDKLRDNLFNGGNWKEKDEDGRSALHLAAKLGRLDVVKFLIFELLADVNIEDTEGATPLEYALSSTYPEKCLDVLFYLLVLGANPIRETKVSNFKKLVQRYEALHDGKEKTILKRAGLLCSSQAPAKSSSVSNVDVSHHEMKQSLKKHIEDSKVSLMPNC